MMEVNGISKNLTMERKPTQTSEQVPLVEPTKKQSTQDIVTITSIPGVDYELEISGGGDKPPP